jgi:penicillin-binding protein 1B
LPIRIKLQPKVRRLQKAATRSAIRRISLYVLAGVLATLLVAGVWVSLVYSKYARLTDDKLAQGVVPHSSMLYAAPELIGVGDPGTPLSLAARLRQSGYEEDARDNVVGRYHLRPDAIEIFPGDKSATQSEPAILRFQNGKIVSIASVSDNTTRTSYEVEPQLITSLYDKNREKRLLVRYDEVPPTLVNAILAIEDKRFFQHSGFDPVRMLKAVWVDLRQGRKDQGASTLTQQLAKMLWLDPRKTFARKFDELLITIHLERKLSKQQIFEYYVNQVPLGRRGSFAIRGFGEAAQAYFGKGVWQLSIPEAATLAGIIQQPSFRNPVRWPERARLRRNVVLRQMLENGYISQPQFEEASAATMELSSRGIASTDAPYFVDLVSEKLNAEFQDRDFQDSGSKIYTTLDPQLQRDAGEAVVSGMREIDELIAKQGKHGVTLEEPQVALICLDPHTGEVKALIGGKNYGLSQLNHAVVKRPSGSIIKPFVYAAALNTGLWNTPDPITDSTIFEDEPQTFTFAGEDYEPADFHKNEWMGDVTVRTAFAKSLNVPAVEVAEKTGYGAVANLAHKAGLPDIRATPSVALGAYNVTPLEIAGAYTIFSNNGVIVTPRLISRIADQDGKTVWEGQAQTKKVLDPRTSFLILDLMQEVLRSGTGAGVRSRGFSLPAAGKTGTSHDAWFAGFTTKVLCVVWVGLDDYKDIKMEGAKAALPIWTEFMKRAHRHRAYRDVAQFDVPDGVVSAQIDADTGQLATSLCPRIDTAYFLLGTQPTQFCPLHPNGGTEIAGWDAPPVPQIPNLPDSSQSLAEAAHDTLLQNPTGASARKHGIVEKLKSIFK